jgi:hypothetical protein
MSAEQLTREEAESLVERFPVDPGSKSTILSILRSHWANQLDPSAVRRELGAHDAAAGKGNILAGFHRTTIKGPVRQQHEEEQLAAQLEANRRKADAHLTSDQR